MLVALWVDSTSANVNEMAVVQAGSLLLFKHDSTRAIFRLDWVPRPPTGYSVATDAWEIIR